MSKGTFLQWWSSSSLETFSPLFHVCVVLCFLSSELVLQSWRQAADLQGQLWKSLHGFYREVLQNSGTVVPPAERGPELHEICELPAALASKSKVEMWVTMEQRHQNPASRICCWDLFQHPQIETERWCRVWFLTAVKS